MPSSEVGHQNDSKTHVVTAGIIAGLFSRFVIAPLDVVKIRLQLQPHGPPHRNPSTILDGPYYRGIAQTMRTIAVQEGIRGLWKGNVPAELLYMTYGATQFLAYHECSAMVSNLPFHKSDAVTSFVAGAAAGGIATAATYPLDLLRTRFAAQGTDRFYSSLYHSIAHIYEHEGVKGFYRGVGAGVSQIVPYMGIFFCTYEATKASFSGSQIVPEGWHEALSGGFAATVGKTCVFPLDLIRKRLQVQGPTRQKYVYRNIPAYAGVYSAARDILRTEGPRGLYKGLTVSLIKAAPLSAVTMWSFEYSLRLLQKLDNGVDL